MQAPNTMPANQTKPATQDATGNKPANKTINSVLMKSRGVPANAKDKPEVPNVHVESLKQKPSATLYDLSDPDLPFEEYVEKASENVKVIEENPNSLLRLEGL